ncbi:MAG TPA: hypothetical protein PLU37_11005 [Chitinophagaceae bacterium]|nr:hypothetical protein [Chitinophagales bacterium]HPG12052.1 hypothetical protein [Chitinophagaceae bacterium]
MRLFYIHISFLTIFLFFSTTLSCQEKEVLIRIQQDDSYLLSNYENNITLKKNTFKIYVYLQNMDGVYVFASFGDSLNQLSANDPIPGFSEIPYMVMAEEYFNKEKELLISDQGWSYWFYDPQLDWHRFNKKIVQIETGGLVGKKTIKQVYVVEKRKEVKVKELKKPLYLFFVAIKESDNKGNPLTELMRRKVKIEWEEDDD